MRELAAYLQHGKWGGPYLTEKVELKEALLWWQVQGLTYTATGYGSKIPTTYMVKHNNRWKRVYCVCYSNIGTLYIMDKKEKIVVDINNH